jgi:hypothetical protein
MGCLALALAACQAAPPPPTPTPAGTPTPQRAVNVLVSRQDGTPVAGAAVCAAPTSGEESCTETGAAGAASLTVRPATYTIRVTPLPGQRFAPERRPVNAIGADATVTIRLEPRSFITGTVRDEAGAAVAGAEVCAHPPSTTIDPTCGKSGAGGGFTLAVRSDVYKLDVSGPAGARLIPQWARGRLDSAEADVFDVRTDDASGVDVTLVKGVVLRGTIRSGAGVVENAQVCLRTLAAPLPLECERTRKDGSYAALREPGQYYMWVVPPDNVRLVAQWYPGALTGIGAAAITLGGDRTIDLALPLGPQIRGTVRTSDGVAVAGALVCVDTPFPTGRICRPTSIDGSYTVTTRPETYAVQVLPPDGSDIIVEYVAGKRTWVDADDVTLGPGDRVLDITVRRGVRVEGTVRDARGVPLEGATVNLNDAAGVAGAGETDLRGHYGFAVPPGHYTVDAFAPFRGERLSVVGHDLDVSGFTVYDVTLPDASP